MVDFYIPSGYPGIKGFGSSDDAKAEFALIGTEISDRLAPYTGNGDYILKINAGGTAYEAVTVGSFKSTYNLVTGTDIQAWDSILDGTEESFTTVLKTNYDSAYSWGNHALAGYITATLTDEEVQDIVGGMLGGTETGITVTYQDGTGDIDFVVTGLTTTQFASSNISQWTNDSGFITGYTVTEGDVTAHEAALTITKSQISDLDPDVIVIACSDEATDLTTGTSIVTFRMPFAMTLTAVRANVNTAPVGSAIIADINDGGTSIMTTDKLSIDAVEKTSTTAATPAVITDAALADDAEITIDIDQIGSGTAGKGLKVYLIGTRT